MFLFKSHIQQHLSASISEFLNFSGFWVTSESRDPFVGLYLLGYLFFLILRVDFIHVMRFQHMRVPSA